MRHMSSGELVKLIAQVGPRRDMWQHMIGGKSKVDGQGDKGNPRNHLELDKWQVRGHLT